MAPSEGLGRPCDDWKPSCSQLEFSRGCTPRGPAAASSWRQARPPQRTPAQAGHGEWHPRLVERPAHPPVICMFGALGVLHPILQASGRPNHGFSRDDMSEEVRIADVFENGVDWADAGRFGQRLVGRVSGLAPDSSDNTAHVRMPTLTCWRLVSGSFGTFRLTLDSSGFVVSI